MTTRKTGSVKRKQPSFLSQKQEQVHARELAASPHEPLKLRAEDPLDLKVIAALLQDAIVPGTNLHYDAKEQTFTLLANRFCWEESPERLNHKKVYGRILCCLQFQNVEKVQHIDLDPQKPEAHYNLLDIEGGHEGELILIFSGASRLRLQIRAVSCTVTDLEDIGYTTLKPNHDSDMEHVA